jgi:hypothetical protein
MAPKQPSNLLALTWHRHWLQAQHCNMSRSQHNCKDSFRPYLCSWRWSMEWVQPLLTFVSQFTTRRRWTSVNQAHSWIIHWTSWLRYRDWYHDLPNHCLWRSQRASCCGRTISLQIYSSHSTKANGTQSQIPPPYFYCCHWFFYIFDHSSYLKNIKHIFYYDLFYY